MVELLTAFFDHLLRSAVRNGERYVISAGLLYLLFFVWKRRAWAHRKIQPIPPSPRRIRHELLWSVMSLAVFGAMSSLTTVSGLRARMLWYSDAAEYGWAYFALSVAGLILAHDAWFYWTHRLLHTGWLFRHVHAVHHHSTDPTPWAAFSFHPVEAVVQVVFFLAVPLLVPLHRDAVLIAILYQMGLNTLGHLGYEVMPAGYVRNPLTSWQNTPTHHNMHHRHVHCNYGLYFNFWDRWMGTNHPDYLKTFDEIHARRPEGLESGEGAAREAPSNVPVRT